VSADAGTPNQTLQQTAGHVGFLGFVAHSAPAAAELGRSAAEGGGGATVAEPTQINLSRALKLKNRVVHRLSQLDTQIATYNSVIEDNQEYDVRQLYKARMVLAEQLVKLKVAINAANQPIQGLIFELAECKALVAMLGKVNTKHGPSVEGFTGAKTNYVAQFRKPDIDKEVRRVEKEIDRIQDELDRFNHRTLIAVDASLLADSDPPPDAIR
jgi:hypothetical protein